MSYNESLNPNSNYPIMTQNQWDNAPFNEYTPIDKSFEVSCSQTLSKTVTIITDNYIPEPPEKEDYNDAYTENNADTSSTNWANEYHDNGYHTPRQLIELFGQFLQQQLSYGFIFKSPKFTEDLIKECKDWIEDETEYVEE